MASLNRQVLRSSPQPRTHEGAPASPISTFLALRRSVMACMLWENTFYESGVTIADRIKDLVSKNLATDVVNIAIDARERMKLRHVPLLLAREMARNTHQKGSVANLLERIIQRPDEIAEYLAIYWKDGKTPISAQSKKGLAKAFAKFNEYELAKYRREGQPITLRDVLFLTHANPNPLRKEKYDRHVRKELKGVYPEDLTSDELLYAALAENKLATPDTWEVALSAGANKQETFERLMQKKKLGALATLRNLRNMRDAGISKEFVAEYLDSIRLDRVLPFRFIAAARVVPQWEDILEQPMLKCLEGSSKLSGNTALFVDVSGSMDTPISTKSDINRIDAACGLAILLREQCTSVDIYTFSDKCVEVPARRGFALRDAIIGSQKHSGTYLGKALNEVFARPEGRLDRTIVITDEQSADRIPSPKGEGYIINVAAYQNGIGYNQWTKIDGWSEACLDYISAVEESGYKFH